MDDDVLLYLINDYRLTLQATYVLCIVTLYEWNHLKKYARMTLGLQVELSLYIKLHTCIYP